MPAVTVTTSPEITYDFLASLANHEVFVDHFMSDFQPAGARAEVGSRLEAVVLAPGGRQIPTVFEIVAAVRPVRILERATSGAGVRVSESTWTLEPTDEGGTRIEFEVVSTQVGRFERLAMPLIKRWVRKQNERALERLGQHLGPASGEKED